MAGRAAAIPATTGGEAGRAMAAAGSIVRRAIALGLGAVLCAALAGCGTVPRGAGFQSEVLAAAGPGTGAGADASGSVRDFAVVPVTRGTLAPVSAWPVTGPGGYDWIRRQEQPASMIIAAGDTLAVTVWDTEENSLLAGPGGRVAQIPDVRVSTAGSIFLPFVGNLTVAGMSEASARERIEERYVDTIPSAQVQVVLSPGRANTANLVGGVSAPGVYPLEDRNVTLLTLLSLGGGVLPGLENPQVRLFRGANAYGVSLGRLYDDPGLDTTLVGGDRVIVEEEERFFLSLGATGTESLHIFPGDRVTALQALSIIGGVTDNRADPKGVLILREYPAASVVPVTVAADGAPDGAPDGVAPELITPAGPPQDRVVFTIDLTTADGLFSARNFEIMPGDLVYATESPVTAAQTVMSLIGSGLGLASRAGVGG